MGCGISKTLSEEEQLLRKTADAFRAKVIRDVELNRERSDAKNHEFEHAHDESLPHSNSVSDVDARNSTSSTGSVVPVENAEARSSFTSLHSGMSRAESQMQPLRSFSHVERGSLVMGDHLVETRGDIALHVPGKVGCEDDKVIIKGDSQSHMLLRTRRVHKHKKGVKKIFANRRLTNLEQETVEEESEETHEGAKQELAEDEKRIVIKALQRHFLSASLQRDEHELLVQQVVRMELGKREVICRKGEKGDCCYILLSGLCAVEAESSEQIAQLSAGHMFGELAMLYDVPRTATIVCASQRAILCKIRGPCFRRCLARFKERSLSETLRFLNSHAIFSKLALEEKRLFANVLCPEVFELGALLIDENVGSSADWMYLVQEGSVEITDQYKNRKVLGEGATFSGQRMPYGQKAMAAKALSKLRVLAIGHHVMDRLFGNISEVLRLATVRHHLDNWKVFRDLTEKQQQSVAALFQEQHFKKGEVIVTAMADPQLALVMEGTVLVVDPSVSILDACDSNEGGCSSREQCGHLAGITGSAGNGGGDSDNEPEVELPHSRSLQKKQSREHGDGSTGMGTCALIGVARTLSAGELYGEGTFRENCCMEHSLVAQTDVLMCRAGHDEVCRALRGHAEKTLPLSQIVQRNHIKECLQGIFPFSALYEDMLDVVVEAFETAEYHFNEPIVTIGDESRRFCLIVEGEVVRGVGKNVEPLTRWSSFGVLQLLLDKPVDIEVRAAATGCIVKSIATSAFVETCGVLFNELATKMKYKDLQIKHFDIIKLDRLGEGQFGVVSKVGVRGLFGETFALKRISKRKVLDTDQQSPVKLEREILADCCHPLIVRLVTTFQDERSVYILMENLTGGDLFTAIRDIGILNEEQTLFFGASIVLAVEYLHSRNIIYRDLKPENVMLMGSGFLKLVDMGCCSRKVRSYTFVGTPEYLAPEVVLGKGYGQAVDWWSVGVIMYEMICGPLPFGEGCTDPLEVMKEVLEKPLLIPTKVTPEASDLLTSLLERMPEQRLGSSTLRTASEVKEHQFFDLLHWDAILAQSTMPPYIPSTVPDGEQSLARSGSMPIDQDSVQRMGATVQLSSSLSLRLASGNGSHSGLPSAVGLGDAAEQESWPPSQTYADDDDEDVPELPDANADLSCFEDF